MTKQVVWVHDEMLRAGCVPGGAPALFVFDAEWIAGERVSLKRIVFVYECLAEINATRETPIEIAKGEVVPSVTAFAARHEADEIITQRSPLPRIKRQGEALGVRYAEPEPIATLPEGADLKRFSRYWRKAEKQVMRRDG